MVCSMVHNVILVHASHSATVRTLVFMDSSITVTDRVSLLSERTTSLAGASKKEKLYSIQISSWRTRTDVTSSVCILW